MLGVCLIGHGISPKPFDRVIQRRSLIFVAARRTIGESSVFRQGFRKPETPVFSIPYTPIKTYVKCDLNSARNICNESEPSGFPLQFI